MSKRKLGYLSGIFLMATLSVTPHLLAVGGIGYLWYMQGIRWPFPTLPGMGFGQSFSNLYGQSIYWRDQLVLTSTRNAGESATVWTFTQIDPETGKTRPLQITVPSRGIHRSFIIGDRMWLHDSNETYEVVDETPQKCRTPFSVPWKLASPWGGGGELFLLQDNPAYVEKTANGFTVYAYQDEAWNALGNLLFPDFGQERQYVGHTEKITLASVPGKTSAVQIFNTGDELHVFLKHDGRILYRKGLKLDSENETIPMPSGSSGEEEQDRIATIAHTDASASDLTNTLSEDDISNWSLVRLEPAATPKVTSFLHGLLIEGQPAALIVDGALEGSPVGRLYRFDGSAWVESANQPLPFGSEMFRTLTSADGQRSFLSVMTTTRVSRLYAIEASGLRSTKGLDRRYESSWLNMELNSAVFDLLFNAVIFGITFLIGIVLAICVGGLMWLCTQPAYGFGVHNVRLASLGWRGIARMIDLSLIGLTTIGLAALLLKGFDWLSFAEALNLHVDHSTTRTALRVTAVLGIWLTTLVSAILIAQARWGITPGKWLCRLRTVRTSLRPIGFARSLAREFVFFVDCGNFLCWTPAIISIALTDHRQRLGDLVADTIVIESR